MLRRYTDQERTAVRNKYGTSAVMKVAEVICHRFDNQLQNFSLWPEELFVWTTVVLDDVKEHGDEYMMRIGNLWKVHHSTFRLFDKSIPQEELQLTVALSLYEPILMLLASNDSVHQYMGKQILDMVSQNYERCEDTFLDASAYCNHLMPEVAQWINGFMALDNDEYLSDEVKELLAPLQNAQKEAPTQVVNVTVGPGGEYVQNKNVQNEIGNVEPGGTGFSY